MLKNSYLFSKTKIKLLNTFSFITETERASMVESLDVLIVGAGFSGLHMLQKLRKLGFKVKINEAGSAMGGVWHWNCYPGARVDSDFPFYQFSEEDLWKDFEWTERFPGQKELERYFQHVDNKLDLSKDINFNARVTSAEFNSSSNQWLIKANGSDVITAQANFLILCTGFADRRHTPSFKGIENFKGATIHSSLWPKNGADVAGKRVAVIGTGASGVQIIQEIATEVSHLTVYQRTPNLALPMKQSSLADQSNWKFPRLDEFQAIFDKSRTTFGGMAFDVIPSNGSAATAEEREAVFEDLFKRGGFYFWVGTYKDVFTNQEVNDAAYQFWCKKARARINDPVKKDILAPTVAPHPFGTKRPSLEQRYFEVFNRDNVDIINVRKSPILEITNNGIKSEKEGVIDVDVIIFATGFDQTGGILSIDMRNDRNESIQHKWKNGVWTNFGISTSGFPNMFFAYGPQAPTGVANGPTLAELQGDWIIELLVKMKKDGKIRIVAAEESESKWKEILTDTWNQTLFPLAESWYQGANIPGRQRETLNYVGGIPKYMTVLNDCAKNNYEGFLMS